jgi:hypothetical protein
MTQPTNRSLLGFKVQTKNRHDDFETQITKLELSVLRSKPKNPPPHWLWGSTKKPKAGFEAKPGETVAINFEDKPAKTVATGFEDKPVETVRVILMPNHSQTVDLGFEAQPKNPHS